jgi:hypothetical protein
VLIKKIPPRSSFISLSSLSRSLRTDHAVIEILLCSMLRAEAAKVGTSIITTECAGQAVVDR